MSKINNKVLLLVFVVLAAAYFGNKYLGGSKDRNFREVLIKLDTTEISKLILTPPKGKGIEVTVSKTGSNWEASNGTLKDDADKSMVRSMLGSLSALKPKRLVASSENKWAEYQVTDSLGTKVKAFEGDKLVADLVVGKFDFQQETRTMSTFVRLAKEVEVYSVDGFLSSTFTTDFNGLRDKTFLKFKKDNLTSIRYNYPADSSFTMSKVDGKWQINGQSADSTSVERFLNSAATLNLRDFVDNFQPMDAPVYTMSLDGDNMSTIAIQCYAQGDDYILHSSLNEDAWFKKGSINIFDRLFAPAKKFKPSE